MAKSKRRSYGLGRPMERYQPFPLETTRAPTTSDVNYDIGQIWVRTDTNQSWTLTSVSSGSATWSLSSPGSSDVDTINSLPPTAGNIVVDGGTNITDANAGSTVTLNLDDAIVLATSVTAPLYTAAAATDVAVTAPTGQDIVLKLGDNAAANKFSILDSDDVEIYSVDSNGTETIAGLTVAGAFVSNGGRVTLGSDNAANAIIVGGGTTARAITIGQDAAAHTIAIGQAAAGAITVDTAAGISIGAATASDFTLSGAGEDLTLESTLGRVIVNAEEAADNAVTILSAAGGLDVDVALQLSLVSSEAAGDAIVIDASNAAGGIDIDDGGGGTTVDSAGAISLDAAAASNFSVSGAGIDLSLISAAGRLVLNAEEAVDDAIKVSSAAGGIDVDSALSLTLSSSENTADAIVINSSAGGMDLTAAGAAGEDVDITCTSGSVNITAGESAADSVVITSSIGGIDILAAGAAAGEDIDIIATGSSVNIEGTEADGSAITVKASDAAGGVVVECGTGGCSLAANATAHTTTLGSTNTTSATVIQSGTGRTTFTGTVKEIDAEFLYSSGTDLTITQSPVMQTAATTGGVPTGTTGDVNLMYMQDGCLMEQFIMGDGQTIIAPRMSANGLNISLDQTDDEGAEYNFGMRANAKHAYTIGTSAAFFVEAEIYVADMTGCEPMFLGFRKVAANDGDYTNYTDFYVIGVNNATSSAKATVGGRLNSGGITLQDTTDAWGDTTAKTVKILVSAAGVITATIDGSAVTAPLAQTFDNGDVVAPFIHFLHDTTTPGEISLVSFKCGFQA